MEIWCSIIGLSLKMGKLMSGKAALQGAGFMLQKGKGKKIMCSCSVASGCSFWHPRTGLNWCILVPLAVHWPREGQTCKPLCFGGVVLPYFVLSFSIAPLF